MGSTSIIISGTVSQGALLGLISIGFVVIFRATKVVSFAQGAFMVLGALLFGGWANGGMGVIAAMLAAAAVTGVAAALVYRFALARVVGESPLIPAIASIGIGAGGYAIMLLFWPDQLIALNKSYFGQNGHNVLGVSLTGVDIFTIALALVTFAIVIGTIQWTQFGLRMRAVADQPRLAAYVGIRTVWTSAAAWGIAGACAALAGVAYVVSSQPTPDDVNNVGLVAFPAILLGGMDSIPGALIGSLVLAGVQSFVDYHYGGQYQDVVSYSLLLIVLLIRPQGILGTAQASRI